jgi:hypothetical protein
MRIEAVVGRATAYDLETVPAVEPDVVLRHFGSVERQAADATGSRHLLDPLQQLASHAGALSCRIDGDLVDVDAFVLPLHPDDTGDLAGLQGEEDVAALQSLWQRTKP